MNFSSLKRAEHRTDNTAQHRTHNTAQYRTHNRAEHRTHNNIGVNTNIKVDLDNNSKHFSIHGNQKHTVTHEKVNQEKVNQEKLKQEKVNQEKVNQEKVNQEKVNQEKVNQEKVNQENKLIPNNRMRNIMQNEINSRDLILQFIKEKKQTMTNINKNIWIWNNIKNTKPIELTVALPALNASKIIWLALESLKNQINIDFAWELIVFEEEGTCKNIVQQYKNVLPGCERIIFRTITKDDMFYTIDEIKKNKCASYYTLLEKWIAMSKFADINSKIFVKQSADCYSTPKRLSIHYEHFKNNNCYYSTQSKGYFYNINLQKYFFYDGMRIEPYNWKGYYKANNLQYNNTKNNTNVLIRGCHLNMALRTREMRKVPLPPTPKRAGLDGYILYHITKIINISPEEQKIIFNDSENDQENWKYSLDTDGHNNISWSRSSAYIKYDAKNKPHCIPVTDSDTNYLKIPKYVMDRLYSMKN